MDRNNFYLVLSGFLSLTFFSLIIILFFYMVFNFSNTKVFALKKDNFISISIELPKTEILESKKKSNVTTPDIEDSKDIDVGELFSDVWTKKIEKKKVEKKKVNKRLQEVLTKTKKLEKKEFSTKEVKQKVETSSGDEVNEYLAKIQAIVYKNFYPPANSQGHSVKAVIVLSSIGKVNDFRILRYSENLALNKECDKIKNRLLGQLFPVNPDKNSGTYTIILTSKE
jgi:protein TonB